jgi:hypothetical protein
VSLGVDGCRRGRESKKEGVNGLCVGVTPHPDGTTPTTPEIRSALAGVIDGTANLAVTLDGHSIKASQLATDFRVQSTVYSTIVPEGSLYQAIGEPVIGPGTYLGIDDGVYVMLKPLKKGPHTLRFQGALPLFDFALDVTYYLTVE